MISTWWVRSILCGVAALAGLPLLVSDAAAQAPPVAAAQSCPLQENALDERFHLAFGDSQLADELRALVGKVSDREATACWKLAELQSRDKYKPLTDQPATPERFWLSDKDVAESSQDGPTLHRKLLEACLPVLERCSIALPKAAPSATDLHPGMVKQLRDACEVTAHAKLDGCRALRRTGSWIRPSELAPQRRLYLGLGLTGVGLGIASFTLGVVQLAMPLRADYGTQSCVQHGLYHPCGPDQLGLGLPLLVGGAGLISLGGVAVHRSRQLAGDVR